MKKKYITLIAIVSALCVIALVLGLYFGGVLTKPEKIKICDAYPKFENEPVCIEVDFRNPDTENYTISDKRQVKEIYDTVYNMEFVRSKGTLPPGFNTVVTFVYEDNGKVSVSATVTYRGETYYAGEYLKLMDKISRT